MKIPKLERKVFSAEVKEFDDEQLTVTHFISTEKRDRGGDSMKADGMKIRGKVVVLLAHGFSSMGQEPIAKPLKIWPDTFKGSPGICAMTQFYDGSHLNPPDNTGRRFYDKTKNGYMPNWSIGWIPIKWEDIKGPHGEYYRDVIEWELLEYSPVGVPMNPDCQTVDKSGKCNVDKCGTCQKEAWFRVLPDDVVPVGKEEFKHYTYLDGKPLWKEDDREELEKKLGDLCQYKDGLLCDMEGKPYPNEHACCINDPKKYDRIRRNNDKFGKGIHALWGIKKGNPVELQAIRFSKSKFTPAEARKWCKDHEYKCKPFEPASEKCATCGAEMVWKWFMEDEEDGVYSCEACKGIKAKKNECKCDNEKCGHTVAWDSNCHGMKCLKCGKGTLRRVKKTKKDLEGKMSVETKSGRMFIGIHSIPTLIGVDIYSEPKLREILEFTREFLNRGTPVTLMADDDSICELDKDKIRLLEEPKGAIPYKKTPSAKDDEPWSLREEIGKASLDDLREMAVWVDEKRPKAKGSYKGIHHKAGGDYPVVKKAVRALAANLLNSRGGIHIPTVDLKKAREHCASHYEDLGMGEVPWKSKKGIEFVEWVAISFDLSGISFRSFTEEDNKKIFEKAKTLIPDLVEFFSLEYKQDDWGYGDGGDGDGTGDSAEPNLTESETVVIEMIDGQEIRDRMDNLGIEYTMGGHHYVYPDLVPEENKIIVDGRMSDEDIVATKVHEFTERELMKYYDFPYNNAHEIANIAEEGVRHILKDCEDGGHGGVLGDGRNHDPEHRGNHHHDHGRTVDHTWEQDALNVVKELYQAWDEMKKLGQHDDECTFDSICPACKTPIGKCDKHVEAMATRIVKMDKAIADCEEKIGQGISSASTDVRDEELDSFIDFIKTMKEKFNSIELMVAALTNKQNDMCEHYIEKCSVCDKVISSCRCSSKDKVIKLSVCKECREKNKTSEPQKIVAVNGGDEEKRMLAEISKQLSREFSDLITQYEENTRKLIRAEINKAKGRVE